MRFRHRTHSRCCLMQVIALQPSLSLSIHGKRRAHFRDDIMWVTGRQGRLRQCRGCAEVAWPFAPPQCNPDPRGADRPCRVGAQCNYEGAARSILAWSAKNTKGGMHFCTNVAEEDGSYACADVDPKAVCGLPESHRCPSLVSGLPPLRMNFVT